MLGHRRDDGDQPLARAVWGLHTRDTCRAKTAKIGHLLRKAVVCRTPSLAADGPVEFWNQQIQKMGQ